MATTTANFNTLTMVYPASLKFAERRFVWCPIFKKNGAIEMFAAPEIAKDGRIACQCRKYQSTLATDTPTLCDHLETALSLLDSVGWNRLRADTPWSNGEKIGARS